MGVGGYGQGGINRSNERATGVSGHQSSQIGRQVPRHGRDVSRSNDNQNETSFNDSQVGGGPAVSPEVLKLQANRPDERFQRTRGQRRDIKSQDEQKEPVKQNRWVRSTNFTNTSKTRETNTSQTKQASSQKRTQ